ncbi:calcium-binding protein [Citreimonas salinaria]|uniref:Hemolysin-type calcium-binding repeat-containing protein n=1 Tax=Citreimonas salinaria TaxID=321339 RepID=A0A1H3M824_9RHOB|nr:calcium-binding protein [Citreimonas salinaria]SDY72763.1 Hemolysin-type calcium-binding repeat-containing protein [Citreimonas salinaria]
MLLLAGLLGALAAGSFVAISVAGAEEEDEFDTRADVDTEDGENPGGAAGNTSLLDQLGILDFMDRAGEGDGTLDDVSDDEDSPGDGTGEAWPEEAADAAWSVTGEGWLASVTDEAGEGGADDLPDDPTGTVPLILEGENGDDSMAGGGGHDVLGGHDGDDVLAGLQGDDSLVGGDGADWLDGGADDDTLHGQAGDDRLDGGEGDDALFGHHGDDALRGGAGEDELQGGLGYDWLAGGAGNDAIHGREGDDTLMGGQGSDTLMGGNGDDLLSGLDEGEAPAVDYLNGHDGDDTLVAGRGDVVTGGAGADLIMLGEWLQPPNGGVEDPGAAQLMDFDPAEDQIVILYDDSDAGAPQVDMRPNDEDPTRTEILIDGAVVSVLATADAPALADLVLIGEAEAGLLLAG